MNELITKNTPGVLPWTADQNLEGLVFVLDGMALAHEYREPRYQLWRATGGFGCNRHGLGRAIFATALADAAKTRWQSYEVIGIASDDLVKSVFGDTVPCA